MELWGFLPNRASFEVGNFLLEFPRRASLAHHSNQMGSNDGSIGARSQHAANIRTTCYPKPRGRCPLGVPPKAADLWSTT